MEPQNVCGRSCTEGGTYPFPCALGLRVDESICISDLEEGNQYKFLGGGEQE